MKVFYRGDRYRSLHTYALHISEIGATFMFVGYPFSISISQFGLFLAVIGWALFSFFRSKALRCNVPAEELEASMPLVLPLPFWFALTLYLYISFSLVYHASLAGSLTSFFADIKQGVFDGPGDMILMLALPWSLAYTADDKRYEKLIRLIQIGFLILIVTGFVSLFSKWRLNRIAYHFTHGWNESVHARYQHYLFDLVHIRGYPVHLYMPIGFMNTHLTFAALLAMHVPYFLNTKLDLFIKELAGRSPIAILKSTLLFIKNNFQKSSLFSWTLLFISLVLLFANGGRSAIFGLAAALVFLFIFMTLSHWRKRVIPFLFLSFFVLTVTLPLVVATGTGSRQFELLMSSFRGEKKHTDYQRSLLWRSVADSVRENPLLGVGPGKLTRDVERRSEEYSKQSPDLWFAYSVIQRGHAHNDYLQMLALGGWVALLLYLGMIASYVYIVLRPTNVSSQEGWKFAPVIIFFGGLFQCYFQDDRVLLLFWTLMGVSLRMVHRTSRNE